MFYTYDPPEFQLGAWQLQVATVLYKAGVDDFHHHRKFRCGCCSRSLEPVTTKAEMDLPDHVA